MVEFFSPYMTSLFILPVSTFRVCVPRVNFRLKYSNLSFAMPSMFIHMMFQVQEPCNRFALCIFKVFFFSSCININGTRVRFKVSKYVYIYIYISYTAHYCTPSRDIYRLILFFYKKS